jgi:AAA ATPase domain
MLLGRATERAALGELLEEARGGQSRVLVLCGEPAVGKTALLEDTVQAASGFHLARGSTAQGAVVAPLVVMRAELVQLGLQLGDGSGGWSGSEPALHGLVEVFGLALGETA